MCADFMHVGHLNILEGAAKHGAVIVLLMTDDAMKTYKRAPRMSYTQRERILRGFALVDDVIPCKGPNTYASMARSYKPDFFYHGDDWKNGPQAAGRAAVMAEVESYGGKLIEPPYTPTVSSTGFQNMFKATIEESANTGVLVRGALNDLKRIPSVIEKETGLQEGLLQSLIAGHELDRENMDSVLRILHSTYPVTMKHLVVDRDDSNDGVWYFSQQQSKESGRVLDRTNGYDDKVHYYNYMDTATSALSPFKPELIEQLVHVQDNEPLNPLVVMNKGHLLTQLTFFIGPVNFYCTIRGERQCKVMNTGDSCFITPYVPHSFTSRDPDQYAAIVAVTFSGHVRDVLNDLAHHDIKQVMHHAGNRRNKAEVFTRKLERFSDLRGLTPESIKQVLLDEGFPTERVEGTLTQTSPDAEVVRRIADMLTVPEAELEILQLEVDDEVTYAPPPPETEVAQGSTIDQRHAMASSKHFPDAGGYVWTLSGSATLTSQHFNYIFNYGEVPVDLAWNGNTQTLHPGDSAVVKPFLEVTYTSQKILEDYYPTKLVVCKVSGCVNNEVMHECSLFAEEGLASMATNTSKWW
jgi:methylphosphonate synthase